jgi:putative endonuclease
VEIGMYTVYLLKSQKNGQYYIGQCRDIADRIKRHNRGASLSTKSGLPWTVVYTEEFATRGEAVRREQFLKSPKGWIELQEIKNRIR